MQNPRAVTLWTTQSFVATLALFSLLPMTIIHVTGAALNPITAAISHYVYLPGGYLMVLFGSLLLAGCGLAIGIELIRRSPARSAESVRTAGTPDGGEQGGPRRRLTEERRRRWAAGLLISFSVALVLVGLFPTDPPGSTVNSASAVIHRVGAAWSFFALPLAGVLIAGSTRQCRAGRGRVLVRVAVGLLTAVVIFLSIHFPLALTGAGGIPAFGLLERVGFAFMIGYLILLAVALVPAPATERRRSVRPRPTVIRAGAPLAPASAVATVAVPIVGGPTAAGPTAAGPTAGGPTTRRLSAAMGGRAARSAPSAASARPSSADSLVGAGAIGNSLAAS